MNTPTKKVCIPLLIALTTLAACSKKKTYICQCYGGFTGGATETIQISSDTRENAAAQCTAIAEPPTNTRNSCELQ